ncbi:unnamed protein product [Clonostachys rosea]|uniref:Protein kinase domain-containing protein n=1 Tax=Bionectria ochroleuca TaxID=29856 RepID=A0ABY6UJB7_BIOOC|nr:unnamed protein product [Clonostachys rosea]
MAAPDVWPLPHNDTLFHLIPENAQAQAALDHPDNSRFVSLSTKSGHKGLEVGYHVPSESKGDVITRLGRDADLILIKGEKESRKPPFVSSRHVDFRLNTETQLVMLHVLCNDESPVSVKLHHSKATDADDVEMGGVDAPGHDERREHWGDSVLLYGQSYKITICDYKFNLEWVEKDPEQLKALALQGQKISDEKAKRLPPRKQPTPSNIGSYIRTRPAESPECSVREAEGSLVLKQKSALTFVHKGLDNTSGVYIIVKTIKLGEFGPRRKEEVRSAIEHEVKFLKKHRHPNINPCLGSKDFQTDLPVFYTILARGDISDLSRTQKNLWEGGLLEKMVRQALLGLAFLADNGVCHGSIQPSKILYTYGRTQEETEDEEKADQEKINKYRFLLSDFGISKYAAKPPAQFRAPELWNQPDTAWTMTPKTDVWCLLAACAATHPSTKDDMSQVSSYPALCGVMEKVVRMWPALLPMAAIEPESRAPAAHMLHYLSIFEDAAQSPGAPGPAPLPDPPGSAPLPDPPGSAPLLDPPGSAPPPSGAGRPADGSADPAGQQAEAAGTVTTRYRLRNRTVSHQPQQRRKARHRPY